MAAVVGRANKRGDKCFEGGGIVVLDATVEGEGAHREKRGDVGLDIGICVWGRLLWAVNFDTAAAIGFQLRQRDEELLRYKASWCVWTWDEEVCHIEADVEICDCDLVLVFCFGVRTSDSGGEYWRVFSLVL